MHRHYGQRALAGDSGGRLWRATLAGEFGRMALLGLGGIIVLSDGNSATDLTLVTSRNLLTLPYRPGLALPSTFSPSELHTQQTRAKKGARSCPNRFRPSAALG